MATTAEHKVSSRSDATRGQTIDLDSLPAAQLNQVKNQLTQELQHLTLSFQQLKSAQVKFKDCKTSIKDGLSRDSGTPILIPLTPSLYVPGKLASTETVLVDIGTGFFVEKSPVAAQEFYARKIADLTRNLEDLEKIVQGKQGNLSTVEDVLRRKVMSESQAQEGRKQGEDDR